MQKINLLLLFLAVGRLAFSQLYINTGAGYSFSTNPIKIENTLAYDDFLTCYNFEMDFGKGLNFTFGGGYRINESLAAEFNITTAVLTGSTMDNDWTNYESYGYYSLSGINGHAKTEDRNIRFTPVLVYTIAVGKISPFIKMGMSVLYVSNYRHYNATIREFDNEYQLIHSKISQIAKYTGGLCFGFVGSAGVSYNLSDKMSWYGEITILNSRYHFKKGHVLLYKVDGEDRSDDIEKDVDLDDDEGRVDYSNIGFAAGIRFYL